MRTGEFRTVRRTFAESVLMIIREHDERAGGSERDDDDDGEKAFGV